jgi:eukaryotic-like serine/threonine-protein kinase
MISKGYKVNDRYEILKSIGEGGMANVYLAHDTILDRDVAVKILRGDLANDDKFVRRFQREAISASSLSHPNIVEMYDVGEDDGKYFIVMEYVNGKTLKNLIKKRGALILPEVIDIMLQLTAGIAHAHDSYIIHRDIKPQNVMILDDGMVKITDFGIAMAVNSHEITQTNSVMGSVHYLPPEQANGSGSTIKSDIYSLGILMFELLTGKIPFKGENAVEIAIKQMKEQIPSVCKINSEIPQSLENIILKACAKNPKNRYESARDMYEDIKSCLDIEKVKDKRIVYKYPEQELEKTKKIPILSKINFIKSEGDEHKVTDKQTNKWLLISGLAFLFISTVLALVLLVYPMVARVPDLKVPDVSNMSPEEAEDILLDLGLKIASEDELRPHDTIEAGIVIETKPAKNRNVKKGATVTLIVSSGSQKVTLDDYTNKNYYEIKATLELKGIVVLEEKKEITELNDLTEFSIIDQSPAKGTVVSSGDSVTFFLPELITEYPDFAKDGWSLQEVEAFAETYKLILSKTFEESVAIDPNYIISQSRAPGSKVESNARLTVTVAIEPIETIPEEE